MGFNSAFKGLKMKNITDFSYSINFCTLSLSAIFHARILTESIISAICKPKEYET